eukprot:scaffold1174_cov281-Chaetoceros_neogracile.AAC.32
MQQPSLSIVIINAVLCFTMMPLRTAGMVLLGSVSGGQGSNLFALLAGGDVALSVVCTLSTIIYKVDGNLMVKGTREGPLVICDQR